MNLNNLRVKLQGQKTWIILAGAAVTWFLAAVGVVEPETANQAYAVLTLLGGATVTAKINRLNK